MAERETPGFGKVIIITTQLIIDLMFITFLDFSLGFLAVLIGGLEFLLTGI